MDDRTRLTVIFDLDGTLVDTAEDVGALVNPVLAELGRPALTKAQVIACFGLGAAKLVERALALTGGPLPRHWRRSRGGSWRPLRSRSRSTATPIRG
jgi:phosphoglycolate phosphatase-like HAD superfamily hydrolase